MRWRGGGAAGGVAASNPSAVDRVLRGTTNLEMTDLALNNEDWIFTSCRNVSCTTQNATLDLSYHAPFLRNALRGRGAIHDYDNLSYRMKRQIGSYSGYYAIRFDYYNTGNYYLSGATAFGGPERKPVSGKATWTGSMAGHRATDGTPISGKATVTYSFGRNVAGVRLWNIRGSNYFGSSTLSWPDMHVNNDGSFDYGSKADNEEYLQGNFYGPNAEETSGVFETENRQGSWLTGGWFATR